MRALILLLFSSVAFGQSYTVYKLAAIPVITAHVTLSATGPANCNDKAETLATNGTIYVGWYLCGGTSQAAIWLNGINNPATDLNSLDLHDLDNNTVSLGLTDADSIDANGNIIATQCSTDCWVNGASYLLAPDVNPLQAQLTHVTSQMQFYRQGVVNWEAQALAWQATAYRCKQMRGVC